MLTPGTSREIEWKGKGLLTPPLPLAANTKLFARSHGYNVPFCGVGKLISSVNLIIRTTNSSSMLMITGYTTREDSLNKRWTCSIR